MIIWKHSMKSKEECKIDYINQIDYRMTKKQCKLEPKQMNLRVYLNKKIINFDNILKFFD